MLADVLEGMRGRVVRELERRSAGAEFLGSPCNQNERLEAFVAQVIQALRGRAPGDAARPLPTCDPQLELREHALLAAYLAELAEQGRLEVSPRDRAIIDAWRCAADCNCLHEQNRRLGALLDRVQESAVMLAPDGRLLYCNPRAAHALYEGAGVPKGELIGKTPDELGVPTEHLIGRPLADLVELARAHRSFESSAWGHEKEAQLEAIYRADGSVAAVAFLARDVHSRKVAQTRLNLLSKLSALVGGLDFDEVAQGVANVPVPELADWCAFHVVEDRRISGTFVAHQDPSKDPLWEAIGRSLAQWGRHPLWREMLTGGFQLLSEVSDDLVRTLSINDDQYRLVSQLGIRSLMITPLVSRAQTTGILTLAYTTQSGRRYGHEDPALAQELGFHAARALENARLVRELKLSEARFRIALAGARTVVFEQDASLRYTWYYNPLAPGNTPDLAKKCEQSLAPAEAAMLREVKTGVLQTGEGVRDEVDLTLANDEPRHYREAIEPVRDRTGKIVGIIGAATDITEQQRMRQQLAEDLRFREQMLGILGHDLRNPLNAITLAGEWLLKCSDLPPKEREKLFRIHRSADRMREMIETLLDFTRIRYQGKLPVSFAEADLAEVARGAVDEMRASKPTWQIDVHLEGDTCGRWDPARIAQAISNLISNAIAYGVPGTPVSVVVKGSERDVHVSVNNRGDPMPPEVRELLFEPFRRGVPEDRSPHGLGLGLYIVQQIVIAHEGEIGVESDAERGTTFTMRLPRARAEAGAGAHVN
jgi:signal transduction histidine kinase